MSQRARGEIVLETRFRGRIPAPWVRFTPYGQDSTRRTPKLRWITRSRFPRPSLHGLAWECVIRPSRAQATTSARRPSGSADHRGVQGEAAGGRMGCGQHSSADTSSAKVPAPPCWRRAERRSISEAEGAWRKQARRPVRTDLVRSWWRCAAGGDARRRAQMHRQRSRFLCGGGACSNDSIAGSFHRLTSGEAWLGSAVHVLSLYDVRTVLAGLRKNRILDGSKTQVLWTFQNLILKLAEKPQAL
jgi:hypothetical protein